MGTRLIQLISEDSALTLAAAIVRDGHGALGQDAAARLGLAPAGVAIAAALLCTTSIVLRGKAIKP